MELVFINIQELDLKQVFSSKVICFSNTLVFGIETRQKCLHLVFLQ